MSGWDKETVIARAEGGAGRRWRRWEEGMENGAHSSLGTSARRGEDGEHDSLGTGLCTFNTKLHVNVPRADPSGTVLTR